MTAENKAHLGPGVYCWDNEAAARRYARNKPGAKIMTFTVDADTLAPFRTADMRTMSRQEAEDFMNRYSVLWGGHAGHGTDCIIQAGEEPMIDHCFGSEVLRHLSFGDDLE
jgi:hypothetical protein